MTTEQTLKLIRPNIASLKPYSSARSEFIGSGVALLDANENPYSIWGDPGLNRYPDPLQRRVKQRIAELKGILPQQLFLGNGSDEIIDLLIRCFCEPGKDEIAIFNPTYGMYSVCAAVNNVAVQSFQHNNDFMIDAQYFLKTVNDSVKVVFICNPNNPSGNTQPIETISKIIAEFKGIVVIDEAYIDFCTGKSVLPIISKYPNLVVMQTFSKAWALAGARIGLAAAVPELIQVLNKVKFPYNIGVPSFKALEKAIANSTAKNIHIDEIINERQRIFNILQEFPNVAKVYQSEANFILVKTSNADRIHRYLMEHGIISRNRSRDPLCENCLRITIGIKTENAKLLGVWKNMKLD